MVKRVKRNTRKGKRSSRRSSRRSRQRGGWQNLSPADLSAAQGTEYKNIHKGQYGGAFTGMEGAPVGTTGVLDESLRATARVSTLDNSVAAIQGMSDQSGGGRRRRSRRSRRKQGGGAQALDPADYSAPTHLLSAGAEAKALMQMSPEWKLAENPLSFAPKMSGGRRGRHGSRRGRRGSRRH